MILYFSGTGNSRMVAKSLGRILGERVLPLVDFAREQSVPYDLADNEMLGVVFPVYSWGPPVIVTESLLRLQFSSVPSYVYFVCTCGDDVGKTADIFAKAVARKGWQCKAGFSVIMPNTYVCFPGFDVDSERLARLKLKSMDGRIEFVAGCVSARVEKFDCHEGSLPHLKSYLIRPLFNRFMTSPKAFRTSGSCISCGRCVHVCPLRNISFREKHLQWGNDCAMCLACYHCCSNHAIEYGNMTKGKGQYSFPFTDRKTGDE